VALCFFVALFDPEKRSMKLTLCGMLVALVLLPVCAQQQRSEDKGANIVQEPAVPSLSPLPPVMPQPSSPDEAAKSIDSALQSQVQDALNKDPVFSRDGVKVTATTEGIELSGDVATGRDRLNADRIAQSYARGKKVVNHIVVKGHSGPAGPNPPENPPASLSGEAGNQGSANGSPPRSNQ
jgi:hypothetical protein